MRATIPSANMSLTKTLNPRRFLRLRLCHWPCTLTCLRRGQAKRAGGRTNKYINAKDAADIRRDDRKGREGGGGGDDGGGGGGGQYVGWRKRRRRTGTIQLTIESAWNRCCCNFSLILMCWCVRLTKGQRRQVTARDGQLDTDIEYNCAIKSHNKLQNALFSFRAFRNCTFSTKHCNHTRQSSHQNTCTLCQIMTERARDRPASWKVMRCFPQSSRE